MNFDSEISCASASSRNAKSTRYKRYFLGEKTIIWGPKIGEAEWRGHHCNTFTVVRSGECEHDAKLNIWRLYPKKNPDFDRIWENFFRNLIAPFYQIIMRHGLCQRRCLEVYGGDSWALCKNNVSRLICSYIHTSPLRFVGLTEFLVQPQRFRRWYIR